MEISKIDIRSEIDFATMHKLQVDTFGNFAVDQMKHILLKSHKKTVVFGAFDAGNLVGMNGFVSHEYSTKGRLGVAYQSCMSATAKSHGGRGIFSSLINHAKSALKDDGAGFIFGYPNHNSEPIFTHKLNFRREEVVSLYMPILPSKIFSSFQLKSEARRYDFDNVLQFDARETYSWKRSSQMGSDVLSFEHYTNFVFGRVVERKLVGAKVKIFFVGGYEINKPMLLGDILSRIGRKTGARLVRFVVPQRSPMGAWVKHWKSRGRTEPLIYFALNENLENVVIDAWTGLKDVY